MPQVSNVVAESATVASLAQHPEYAFYSEQLLPEHFTDTKNACLYAALTALARMDVKTVDALNIVSALDSSDETKHMTELITVQDIQSFLDVSGMIARHTPEDYILVAKNVLSAALRRDVLDRLQECEALCLKDDVEDFEQKIYTIMDRVLMDYTATNDVPEFKDVVDDMVNEIKARSNGNFASIPFKFKTLNEYVTIDPGELVIFAADAKQGKSMMLLNCAVDLLKKNQRVLYIDSELSTRLFTCRLLSNLSRIKFRNIKNWQLTQGEENLVRAKIEWIKTKDFTHIYMPIFDSQTIYTICKKMYHVHGPYVLIIDYFKSSSENDAFNTYQELGRLADMVKNRIAGDLNIAALAAAQATSTGKVAESAKLVRSASTIINIASKTEQEIEADGPECGNKKLIVKFNRNGMQMLENDYIDIKFDGDIATYEEATQHSVGYPY